MCAARNIYHVKRKAPIAIMVNATAEIRGSNGSAGTNGSAGSTVFNGFNGFNGR